MFADEEVCPADDSDSDQGYWWRCWSVINLQLCQHLPLLCHHILAQSKMSPRRCMCEMCIYTYILHAVDWQAVALKSRHLLSVDVVELSNSAKAHLSQLEAYTPARMSILCRCYSTAGFVTWHPKNRWPVLCLQGISAAHAKLCQLLVNHEALTAQRDPLTAQADSDGDGSTSPSQLAQETQDLTACREHIVSLMQAMFSHLESCDLTSVDTPGYGSFEDLALAFGLPLYERFLNYKFRVGSLCCCFHIRLHKPCCSTCYCQFRNVR